MRWARCAAATGPCGSRNVRSPAKQRPKLSQGARTPLHNRIHVRPRRPPAHRPVLALLVTWITLWSRRNSKGRRAIAAMRLQRLTRFVARMAPEGSINASHARCMQFPSRSADPRHGIARRLPRSVRRADLRFVLRRQERCSARTPALHLRSRFWQSAPVSMRGRCRRLLQSHRAQAPLSEAR